ncbi:hypothetical protein ACF0H5_012015 [Mactra antiquata]
MDLERDNFKQFNVIIVMEKVNDLRQILLICEGLDTISSVYINNKLIGKTENMFVRYILDIKSDLKVGKNTIRIEFQSAVNYALTKANQTSHKILPKCPPPEFHGECHGHYVRKTMASFGWDMAPAFVTSGIWRDIYITGSNGVTITDVTTQTEQDGDIWTLYVWIYTKICPLHVYNSMIEITLDGTNLSFTKNINLTSEKSTISMEHEIPKGLGVREWWPRGYGKQNLYNLTVKIKDKLDILQSQKTVRFGFRTVELVQDLVSKYERTGRTFYFKINGRPIFLKGSNWVPIDSFPERVTKARLQNYMQSVVDANMNCLRVWGGGNYEADYFYDLSDELGILIWQDFMFSTSMYPADEDFIATVEDEIRYQVRRLKHHPSVFFYSGNNEIEIGINQRWWGPTTPLYSADYVKLFMNTIHDIYMEEDQSTPIIPSTPGNGILTILNGGLSEPGNNLYGDAHLYVYGKRFYTDFIYKTPRFASEYGYQSYPSSELLNSFYNTDEDMFYESPLNDHRQHHFNGNKQMLDLTRMYMKLPNSTDTVKQFKDLLYCTQIVQAIGIRTETEHFRRWQCDVGEYGEGRTMGALYWMLADTWPGPTWSSLEYGGKWKMLHYYAQHFFAPVLISPFINFDKLCIYIINDNITNCGDMETKEDSGTLWPINSSLISYLRNILHTGGYGVPANNFMETLNIRVYSYDNIEKPNFIEEIPFQSVKTAELIYEIKVYELIKRAGCRSINNCFVVCYIGDMETGPVSWYPLGQFNDVSILRKPNLKIASVEVTHDNHTFEIKLTTEEVAVFVWIEAEGIKGRFSDNGFFMFTETKTLLFFAWITVDQKTLLESLNVKSLFDIYT